MEITKEMTIHELLTAKPQAASALMEIGMHCLGCPMSRGESIEQAAKVHDVDVDELLNKIRAL